MRRLTHLVLATATLFTFSHVAFTQTSRTDTLKELERKIDILIEELERMKLGEVAENHYEPMGGLGPAASKVYGLKKTGVSLAGYGEVLYENYAESRDNGTPSGRIDQIDYLRNVLYVGFRFNDWVLFNSEIEFEHATTDDGIGEVAMEFGYIELMLSRYANVRAGMILPPIGIINEKHEPPTYFGTMRPQVERVIIPSTWSANGVGVYGQIVPTLNYHAYVIEGLKAEEFSASNGIRDGRQGGGRAIAKDFGLAGRLAFTGLEGSTIAASFYTGNSGQGATDSRGTVDGRTSLWSFSGEYGFKGLELSALYAGVSIDQADRVSLLAGQTIGSSMYGWYAAGGYDVLPILAPGTEQFLAPYLRYERYNTQSSVAAGFAANPANDRSVFTAGLMYKPHPNVAFKVDYNDFVNQADTGVNQWNIAVNYLY
jgi:hypothetical protein